jgi:hypothetical protein
MDVAFAARLPQFANFRLILGTKVYPCNLEFLTLVSDRIAKLTNETSFRLPDPALYGASPTFGDDLLDAIYGRKISVPRENALALFVCAHLLDIKPLITLPSDLVIPMPTLAKAARAVLACGHSADFLFPTVAGIANLADIPNFVWHSKIEEKAIALLQQHVAAPQAEFDALYQALLDIGKTHPNVILPTYVRVASRGAAIDGVALRRLLELPGLDLRRVPQLGALLATVVEVPRSGDLLKGDAAAEARVRGEGHTRSLVTDRVSFQIGLNGAAIRVKQYAVEGDAGAPTAWTLEGTANGRAWFGIHEQGDGARIEGGLLRFTLPHPSGLARALRFTQIEPPCPAGKIALKAFHITEWIAVGPGSIANK